MNEKIKNYIENMLKQDSMEATVKTFIIKELVEKSETIVDNIDGLGILIEEKLYDKEEYLGSIKTIVDSIDDTLRFSCGKVVAKNPKNNQKIEMEVEFKETIEVLETFKLALSLTAKDVNNLEAILEEEAKMNNRKEIKISNVKEIKIAKISLIKGFLHDFAEALAKDIYEFLQ